jgi:hypothetical protein
VDGDLTKLSFNALPKTVAALVAAAAVTGDTETDSANRAIQLYASLVAAMAAGARLILLHPNGETGEVTLT